ncbi:unknown [Mediterraneibacter gnavus CAG:126]|uniref:Uncharacterized protein n=1 Tax=Mediterraneibacter gnavus CAG:126 TaxID=1263106 RepID=R5TYA4_MEDGN|nr:unknown [Mediterraneibacter gnavus CAG:126]
MSLLMFPYPRFHAQILLQFPASPSSMYPHSFSAVRLSYPSLPSELLPPVQNAPHRAPVPSGSSTAELYSRSWTGSFPPSRYHCSVPVGSAVLSGWRSFSSVPDHEPSFQIFRTSPPDLWPPVHPLQVRWPALSSGVPSTVPPALLPAFSFLPEYTSSAL